jgi:hypothetical protein
MPNPEELLEVERFQWKWKIEKREKRRVPRTNREQITLSAVNSIKYSLRFCCIVPSYPIPHC